MHAVADIEPGAHVLVLAGGDAFEIDEQVVQPRRPGQPGIVGGIEHRLRPVERPLGVVERQVAEELFRADPGPAGEQALEMKRAEGGGIRDVVQLRLVAEIVADIGQRLFDAGVILRLLPGRLLCRMLLCRLP